ncbi:MAG TPA: ABC transporter permease [Thermoanaerobaculia bacterium]|nr:ABC transporter permease [Thermoanaerobaculia bacterium]
MTDPETAVPRPLPVRRSRLIPFAGIALLLVLWDLAIRFGNVPLLPGPVAVARAIGELAYRGFLVKHLVASLFRVTWGYLLAVSVGVPFGILLALYRRGGLALAPLVEVVRPISALAWIPLAILWFGVGDLSSVFIIFIASVFPLAVAAMSAVEGVSSTHWNAGRNFGLSAGEIGRRVLLPAILPRLLVGLRLALGIAWLVVVAAEMIAVNSGLGFLIIDARNAGNRYDLVVAGMVLIGAIGLGLDFAMRRMEGLPALRWGYAGGAETP